MQFWDKFPVCHHTQNVPPDYGITAWVKAGLYNSGIPIQNVGLIIAGAVLGGIGL